MTTQNDFEDLLDIAEDITRSLSVSVTGINAYFINDNKMASLDALVKKHRPIPYALQGGKKVRLAQTCAERA